MRSRLTFCFFVLISLFALLQQVTAQDCYESSIINPSPFMGNNGEIFKLADGSYWEVKYEYEYMYEYYPSIIICPSRGKLSIGDKWLDVISVGAVPDSKTPDSGPNRGWELFEETSLSGVISGTIQQGHIFRTMSGRIYEVTGLTLQLVLELQPDVIVLRQGDIFKLIIDGFDEPLICRKLK